MKIEKPANLNYAAQVVRIPALVELPGLDNLIGVPVLGGQALTQKGEKRVGDLAIAFTAETQLAGGYACHNSLYRSAGLNADPAEKGYLEDNARIKAIRLRKHVSNALLMPLESLSYTGVDLADLTEGVAFDKLGDHEICRKYETPVKHVNNPAKSKVERAFKRVDTKVFPEHLSTDNYWRSRHLLRGGADVVVSQKLHGTSFRAGRVPVLREHKWHEKLLRRLGVRIDSHEYAVVFGSRKVIKDVNNPNQQHYYASDIWTEYGKKIADLIPAGYLVYGELIGWTPDGSPLQKGYTYHLPVGEAELYVYRVAHVNADGMLSDLSWDGVKDFCKFRGLKWTPELTRALPDSDLEDVIAGFMDLRINQEHGNVWNEPALPLSNPKTVDEGVCIRQEGLVPTLLKCKAPKFLEHETKLLDEGDSDMESAA